LRWHTQNQQRGLGAIIVFSMKNTDGKQQVVMHCWVPNNRAWLFNWLFQTAVPVLKGTGSCAGKRLVKQMETRKSLPSLTLPSRNYSEMPNTSTVGGTSLIEAGKEIWVQLEYPIQRIKTPSLCLYKPSKLVI
jgi:hypothetical protein